MITTFRSRKLLRNLGHCAALVFGAFWLVATSAPRPFARDCFTGISSPTAVRVALGTSSNARPVPSCAGIDGLTTGAELLLGVSLGPVTGGCRRYPTSAVMGPQDVSFDFSHAAFDGDFTSVLGTFDSSKAGCTGKWELTLEPVTLPPIGQVISPLDAGPSQPWAVTRRIYEASAGSCADVFEPLVRGQSGFCEDTFEVSHIAEEPAAP